MGDTHLRIFVLAVANFGDEVVQATRDRLGHDLPLGGGAGRAAAAGAGQGLRESGSIHGGIPQ